MEDKREIVNLNSQLENDWSNYVANHPEGLLYYTLKYRDYLIKITGAKAKYKLCLNKGQVVGVFPIMEIEGKYGKVLNSLPFFGSYGSPLVSSLDVINNFYKEWVRMSSSPNIASSTLIQNPFSNHQDFNNMKHNETDVRHAQITDISNINSEDEILDQIESSAKRNIKLAKKNNLKIYEDHNALDFLEITHKENMKAINGIQKPSKYFSSIEGTFEYGKDWKLFVASDEKELLSCILMFYSNSVAEYFTPAVTWKGRNIQASSLILLHAINDARKLGFKMWNWGGTWPNQDGVFRFKKKWGAKSKKYNYIINIKNHDLYNLSFEEISKIYPYFYVIPFSKLKTRNKNEI